MKLPEIETTTLIDFLKHSGVRTERNALIALTGLYANTSYIEIFYFYETIKERLGL